MQSCILESYFCVPLSLSGIPTTGIHDEYFITCGYLPRRGNGARTNIGNFVGFPHGVSINVTQVRGIVNISLCNLPKRVVLFPHFFHICQSWKQRGNYKCWVLHSGNILAFICSVIWRNVVSFVFPLLRQKILPPSSWPCDTRSQPTSPKPQYDSCSLGFIFNAKFLANF